MPIFARLALFFLEPDPAVAAQGDNVADREQAVGACLAVAGSLVLYRLAGLI